MSSFLFYPINLFLLLTLHLCPWIRCEGWLSERIDEENGDRVEQTSKDWAYT